MLAVANSAVTVATAPRPAVFVTGARFEPVVILVLAATTVSYLKAVRDLRSQGGYWSPRRVISWVYGEVALAVALLSGLGAFAPTNFSAFGTQYILGAMLAPLLLVMGAPITLWRSRQGRSGSGDGCDPGSPGRLIRVLSNPFVTWPPFVASMFVLFFTGALGATVAHPVVEQAVFAGLVGLGFLFWWPVVAVDPVGWRLGTWPRIGYLLLVFPAYAILGMTLESQSTGLVAGTSAASLHLGGAIIWVAGETLALSGTVAVFVQWLRADERAARRNDEANEAAAARQLALWRASRDAAARAGSS